jgi:hypothetical protein
MSEGLNEALEAFTRVLAYIYASINWKKTKIRPDRRIPTWNHRIRQSVTRNTIDEAVSRLCNYFGLQALPTEAIMLLDKVRPHAYDVQDVVYREHIIYGVQSAAAAEHLRRPRRQLTLEEIENANTTDTEGSRTD